MHAPVVPLPRRPALRRYAGTAAVCLGVAVLMTIINPGRFWLQLVYSLAIGLSCHAFIEAGMQALVRWQRGRKTLAAGDWPGLPLTAACVVLGAVAGVVVGTLVGDAITGLDTAPTWRNSRAWAAALAVSLVVSALVTSWSYARERLATMQAQAQTSRRAASEAQLRLLESQLEPHMLFNTLATLRALIGIDPPRAQAMLDRLIAYLRATLAASRSPSHTLATEFARLDDYLALMALRMGPRLQVRLDLPTPLREHPVPPLLLQPLVENAIRHGLEPKVDGGRIEVGATREGDTLVLRVRDTGLGLREHVGAGSTQFGSTQVRERLAALHGDAARLTLADAADSDGGAVATVTLPWQSA
jgi:signal transduction histidine kinase